jgi:hypothetical protein
LIYKSDRKSDERQSETLVCKAGRRPAINDRFALIDGELQFGGKSEIPSGTGKTRPHLRQMHPAKPAAHKDFRSARVQSGNAKASRIPDRITAQARFLLMS